MTVVEYSESFVCLFGPLPEVVTREVTRGVATILTARIKGTRDTVFNISDSASLRSCHEQTLLMLTSFVVFSEQRGQIEATTVFIIRVVSFFVLFPDTPHTCMIITSHPNSLSLCMNTTSPGNGGPALHFLHFETR